MTSYILPQNVARHCLGLVLCVAMCFWGSKATYAQDPDCPTDPNPVPEKQPRPAKGPGSVAEFVDNVSKNDAMFEVIVGQGRILTTKTDFALPGKGRALVAVGDPTVVEFVVLNSRQIRLVGQRVGVTDLS